MNFFRLHRLEKSAKNLRMRRFRLGLAGDGGVHNWKQADEAAAAERLQAAQDALKKLKSE